MEEQISRSDLLGNVVRPPLLRVGSNLKPTLSGRLTPRNSPPPLRISQSSRTPRKEAKVYASPLQRIRGRRLLPWLMLIAIWSYVGFVVQSKWAHSGRKEGFTAFGSRVEVDQDLRSNVLVEDRPILNGIKKMDKAISIRSNASEHMVKDNANGKTPPSIENPRYWLQSPMNLARWLWQRNGGLLHPKSVNRLQEVDTQMFRSNSSAQNLENSSNSSADQKDGIKHAVGYIPRRTSGTIVGVESFHGNEDASNGVGMTNKGNNTMSGKIVSGTGREERVKRNTSFGLLVGPFDQTENKVLGWNPGKRYSTCDRKGLFAHVVRGRSFIVVLHELSMTGAPLAMMELAAEILSCGGRVSAIALSKKGGLMEELARRGIKVLKDKTVTSYRVAMKADVVIAGSAVSASWIEQYLVRNRRGASRLVWWVMENRRQYFDRSKHTLTKVKALLFLSKLQSQQWLAWCKEEGIALPSTVDVVPLSVNDELAFVAGLQTALNSPLFSVETMLERKRALRDEVRRSMGLDANDMLVMTLSSINPGKGQLSLLEATLMIAEESLVQKVDSDQVDLMEYSKLSRGTFASADSIVHSSRISRVLPEFPSVNYTGNGSLKSGRAEVVWNEDYLQNASFINTTNIKESFYRGSLHSRLKTGKVLVDSERKRKQTLKLLIGSVGSKSNKVLYIKSMLRLIGNHSKLANLMLWTPATVHVAPLYAAADVYVINAQGIGETFGRVTIEAMAFGLPVLGTDAGGTREIVEDNVTGLLHPVGQRGIQILSHHIRFLLDNPYIREEMGVKGRERIEKLFLKQQMYDRFAGILQKCMKHT